MPLHHRLREFLNAPRRKKNTQTKQTSCLSKSTCVLWMCKEFFMCCRLTVRKSGKKLSCALARALSRAEARCLEISLSKLVYKYIYVYIHSVLYKCLYYTDIAISDLLGVLPSVSACSRHLLIDLEVLYRRHSLYSSQTQNVFYLLVAY